MQTFKLYSAQTGDSWGRIDATSESDALDRFAQQRGYLDRFAMWADRPGLEYVSAYAPGEAK